MSYLSSSAPLPQNSQDPPPAAEVARSNARLLRNFNISREGRDRVYANVPTAASLWKLGPGLAADADYILKASETGRESVLIGVSPDTSAVSAGSPTLAQIQAGAPQVVSLNASTTPLALTTAAVVMPPAAPATVAGVYQGAGGQGLQLHPAPNPLTQIMAGLQKLVASGGGCRQPSSTVELGPGCGFSGYAPTWGSAQMAMAAGNAGCGGASSGAWLYVGLAAAALGLAVVSKRRGRR